MIIRELITKLGFSVDSAALKRGEDAVNNIKNRTNEVSEAAKGATSNIGLMLQAYLSFASASSLARVADAAQSLRARLAMVPQTIGDAGAAFDELAERANFARTSINAYGTLYVRLAGATKDYLKTQEEVLEVTDAISQALAINGATAEEAASVTLQLSQAFQQGYLNGEEFNAFVTGTSVAFREQMVVALREVTGNTNITLAGLKKMSENGELYAKDLALAFKKMAPEIRKQMLSIPLTIGGATQIVRNDFVAMIDRMNRESMVVTRIAGTIVKGFEIIETGIYKITDALGGFNNVLRITTSLIATSFVAKFIKFLIGIDKRTIVLAARWLGWAGLIVAAALAVEDFFRYLQGGASATAEFIDYLIDRFSTWEGLGRFGKDIHNVVVASVDKLVQLENKIQNVKNKFYSKAGAAFQNLVVEPFTQGTAADYQRYMAEQSASFANSGMRPSQSNRYEVNVTLPPGSTPDQVPLWTAEVEKAIDKTIARNITSTVGGR